MIRGTKQYDLCYQEELRSMLNAKYGNASSGCDYMSTV
jgi:hypothetical protein